MTHHHHKPGLRSSAGFSLIELLVSLTIGLVIVVAAISAYLGAASSSKLSDTQSRMNEDAQAALNILSQQIRMAGNNPLQPNRGKDTARNPVYEKTFVGGSFTTNVFTTTSPAPAVSLFQIRGCDGKFGAITTATAIDALTCSAGASTSADSIAVSYEADKFNTIKKKTTNEPTDCLGNGLPSLTYDITVPAVSPSTATTAGVVTVTVAENRFYIGTSTAILSPSLYCQGNGRASTAAPLTAPQPMVENIEDLQFEYGTVSAADTAQEATAAGYLTAAGVVALAPSASASDISAAWGKVLAVRICIVVRSETPVVPDAASGQYINCSGQPDTSKTDLRLRKAYTTTVVLRNRRF